MSNKDELRADLKGADEAYAKIQAGIAGGSELEEVVEELPANNADGMVEDPPEVKVDGETSLNDEPKTVEIPSEELPAAEVEEQEDANLLAKLQKAENRSKSQEGRLRKEIKELKEQVDLLVVNQNTVPDELLEDPEEAIDPELEDIDLNDIISEDDRDLIGEDVLDAAKKIATKITAEALKKQREELLPMIEAAQQNAQSTQGVMFRDSLCAALNVGDDAFSQLDQSPAFAQFLEAPDGLSGLTLNDSLGNAIANGNVSVAVEIYKRFIGGLDEQQSVAVKVNGAAPMPERASNEAPPDVNAQTRLDSYEKVAQAFSQGRISGTEKDRLMSELDAEFMKKLG